MFLWARFYGGLKNVKKECGKSAATIRILDITHAILAVSSFGGDFIPKTWLIGRIMFPLICIYVIREPIKNTKWIVLFVWMLVLAFAWGILSSGTYYLPGYVLGRAWELVPLALCAGALFYLYNSGRRFGSSGLRMAMTASLSIAVCMQFVMSFAQFNFDSYFAQAHFLQILSALPFVLNAGVRNAG